MMSEADIRADERVNCRRVVATLGCYHGVDIDTVNRALLAIDDLGAPDGSERGADALGFPRLRARCVWWQRFAAICFIAALCGLVGCVLLAHSLSICAGIRGETADGG